MHEYNLSLFAEQFNGLIISSGKTQYTIAKLTEIDPSTLRKYRMGDLLPPIESLKKILALCNIVENDLVQWISLRNRCSRLNRYSARDVKLEVAATLGDDPTNSDDKLPEFSWHQRSDEEIQTELSRIGKVEDIGDPNLAATAGKLMWDQLRFHGHPVRPITHRVGRVAGMYLRAVGQYADSTYVFQNLAENSKHEEQGIALQSLALTKESQFLGDVREPLEILNNVEPLIEKGIFEKRLSNLQALTLRNEVNRDIVRITMEMALREDGHHATLQKALAQHQALANGLSDETSAGINHEIWARVYAVLGRLDEARQSLSDSKYDSASITALAKYKRTEALICALEGKVKTADDLIREALAICAKHGFLNNHARIAALRPLLPFLGR